jgi:hypothetical protein
MHCLYREQHKKNTKIEQKKHHAHIRQVLSACALAVMGFSSRQHMPTPFALKYHAKTTHVADRCTPDTLTGAFGS